MDMPKHLLVLFCFLLVNTLCAEGQPAVTLTDPLIAQTEREGDDFATLELNNPWDFNERRDIGWENDFDPTTTAAVAGVWNGVSQNGRDSGSTTNSASLFPLVGGFPFSANSLPLPGDKSLPTFGIQKRIDTQKYTLLSYHLNHSERTSLQLSWESDITLPTYFPSPTSPKATTFDGFPYFSSQLPYEGWQIYTWDLSNLTTSFQFFQGSWSGQVYTLRLDPSITSPSGSQVMLDWIRLVDPQTGVLVPITWTATGFSPSEVAIVFVDTNNSGFDGTPIAYVSGATNGGTYQVNTAIFPPGKYYFYVGMEQPFDTSGNPPVFSGYSAQLQITSRPKLTIISPSPASGKDYASTVLGNAWDMNGAGDIENLDTIHYTDAERNFRSASFVSTSEAEDAGTVFQAETNFQSPSQQFPFGRPPEIHPTLASRDPLDPLRYRYLTFRMRGSETSILSSTDKLLARWFSAGSFTNVEAHLTPGFMSPNFVFEGWHTYTVDLWDSRQLEKGTTPWLDYFRIGNLAVHPLFTTSPTTFQLDWVRLKEENRAENNQFNIQFVVEDSDSTGLKVDLYADTNNQNYDGVAIAQLNNIAAGTYSVLWDTTSFAPNTRYFIYAVAFDGLNSTATYSSVPIYTGTYTLAVRKAPFDYDGDGMSDETVYRRANGKFYEKRSRQGGVSIKWAQGNVYRPITADFDGDGITDLALTFLHGQRIGWYFVPSITKKAKKLDWGKPGDDVFAADFDGDGKDEYGVYRSGDWFIRTAAGTITTFSLGAAGDIPLPYDYDGDGKADFAVWRSQEATWYIRNSNPSHPTVLTIPWGQAGDIPVPGKWFNDQHFDIGVYRPAAGLWVLRDAKTTTASVYPWGQANKDIPVVADFNGDGLSDLTVYREETGTWSHNFRNHHTSSTIWGRPGDLVPRKSMHLAPESSKKKVVKGGKKTKHWSTF